MKSVFFTINRQIPEYRKKHDIEKEEHINLYKKDSYNFFVSLLSLAGKAIQRWKNFD